MTRGSARPLIQTTSPSVTPANRRATVASRLRSRARGRPTAADHAATPRKISGIRKRTRWVDSRIRSQSSRSSRRRRPPRSAAAARSRDRPSGRCSRPASPCTRKNGFGIEADPEAEHDDRHQVEQLAPLRSSAPRSPGSSAARRRPAGTSTACRPRPARCRSPRRPPTTSAGEDADQDGELADEAVQVGRPIDDMVMIRKIVA